MGLAQTGDFGSDGPDGAGPGGDFGSDEPDEPDGMELAQAGDIGPGQMTRTESELKEDRG